MSFRGEKTTLLINRRCQYIWHIFQHVSQQTTSKMNTRIWFLALHYVQEFNTLKPINWKSKMSLDLKTVFQFISLYIHCNWYQRPGYSSSSARQAFLQVVKLTPSLEPEKCDKKYRAHVIKIFHAQLRWAWIFPC